ncbi:MAG: long-chain-fatty-acid--CoA ligase [Hyphomonas sp.]
MATKGDRLRSLDEIADPGIETLADIPRCHAGRTPDRVAMVYEGRSTTFRELDELSDSIARALSSEGIGKGDRVAFLDKNSDAFFPILFGAAKAGATLVPVNFRLTAKEVAYILTDSGSKLIFAGREFVEVVAGAEQNGAAPMTVVPIDSGAGLQGWADENAAKAELPVSPKPADTAVQMYTSGTTGHPKGVEITHYAMIRAAVEGLSLWQAMFRPDAAVLATMPLFHIAACNLGVAGLYAGARAEILRVGTPAEIIRLIADHKITVTPLPAALIHDITKLPEVGELDLTHLDTLLIAGSGIPVELLREAQKVLKCGFALSYGMTECCGGLTYLGPADCTYDAGQKLKSAGKPFGASSIRIVGPDGAQLPPGEIGEILCKTDRVMKGYWNRPEASREALQGEWYHSGDAGYFDEDGYLYVVDRIKDMVISGGENIYPVEVENELIQHPDVDDVAVLGIPDPKWGESLLACVIPRAGAAPSPGDLESFLRPRLAGYKIPRKYTFVDAFPRNATGKVLKRQMRIDFSDFAG